MFKRIKRQFTYSDTLTRYVDTICVSLYGGIVVENTRIFGRFQSLFGLLFSVVSTGSISKSFHVSHQEYDHIDDFLLSFLYGDMWKVFNLYLKSKV